MLPETLTKSPANIPSLTDNQQDAMGFKDNHTRKRNAKMLSYTDSIEYVDDFIDAQTGR